MRFVDTNVFLYAIIKSPKKECETAERILRRIEKGEATATSLAVVQEVIDFLEYNNREKEIVPFLKAINSYFSMEKLDENWSDFSSAIDDFDNLKIDFVDALTLQTIKKHEITEIYSFDKDFDRVKWVRRVWE